MFKRKTIITCAALAAGLLVSACANLTGAGHHPMSFFVTSANPGKGGDLGGPAGADAWCEKLAASAGAGGKQWRAYLSATPASGAPAVHARERIGSGPWRNARGEVVAENLAQLHGDNRLGKQTSLTEKGEVVSGRGDPVNLHDILTGSGEDGRLASGTGDTTCGNWTSGDRGSAIVGHHDRIGLNESAPMKSWNASHATRGCGLEALKSTGGGGLFYCFASR